jgi:RNA polymerase sigma-70 factor (ECF subfamily)
MPHYGEDSVEKVVQSDNSLVLAALARDRDAFGELIRRHHPTCLRLSIYILSNLAEAEEQVQNAYIKAYEHLDQFQGTAEFSSWLSQIVRNQCIMLLRVKARARIVSIDHSSASDEGGAIELLAQSADPECELIRAQIADVLQHEIGRIPPLWRNVVMLRDVEQLPIPEVARRLRITVPAAKARLFRARNELRSRVQRCCGPKCYTATRSSVCALPAKSSCCPATAA